MALSELELDIARQVQEQGGTAQDFEDILAQMRSESQQAPEEAPVPETPKATPIMDTLSGKTAAQQEEYVPPTYGSEASASLEKQVSPEGLIGKGLQTASEVPNPQDLSFFERVGQFPKIAEAGLQILGGAAQEVGSQAGIAAGNIYKKGLEQLDPSTLQTLQDIASAPIERVDAIVSSDAGKYAIAQYNKVKEQIPENVRTDIEAALNILPAKMATKNVSITEKGALKQAEKLAGKAETLSAQVLQPSKFDTLAAKALSEKAKKVKSFPELVSLMQKEKSKAGTELEKALSKVQGSIKDERLSDALQYIYDDATANKALNKLQGVAEANKELKTILEKSKTGLTLSEVQKAKRLIDERFSIYKRSGDVAAGDVAVAMDKERKYIKGLIEEKAPEVKKINTVYEGLREATELSEEMARKLKSDVTPKPGFIKDAILARLNRITGGEKVAPSKIQQAAAALPSKTAEIAELAKDARKQTSLQELFGMGSKPLPESFKIEKQKFVLPETGPTPSNKFNLQKEIEKAKAQDLEKIKADKLKFIPKKK